MENHGKTMENHGKPWKTMEKPWKKHGKIVKSTMFLGRNLDEQLLKPLKL
jgi:hypothetical protein